MRLYDQTIAPYPCRVRVLFAEPGIEAPTAQIGIIKAESRLPGFLVEGLLGETRIVELHEGTFLADSLVRGSVSSSQRQGLAS